MALSSDVNRHAASDFTLNSGVAGMPGSENHAAHWLVHVGVAANLNQPQEGPRSCSEPS